MAKKKNTFIGKQLTPRMKKHLKALGVERRCCYYSWCRRHGFVASLCKSRHELEDEISIWREEQEKAVAQHRIEHDAEMFISAAATGKLYSYDMDRTDWADVCDAFDCFARGSKEAEALADWLILVHQKSKFVFDKVAIGGQTYVYMRGLIRLFENKKRWVRDVSTWKPKTHNRHGQFLSLLHYLLGDYDAPEFLAHAWLSDADGARDHRDWFIHLVKGGSIRVMKTGVPLTKKMAHFFLQAPSYCTVEEALWWGQIHALGGDEKLAKAIFGARLRIKPKTFDFWTSVLRFFIANPNMDRRHVAPIVDFLNAQKYQVREVMVGPGQVRRLKPPQPGLTMKGRTPETLLAQMERWHQELAKSLLAQQYFFRSSGIKGYRNKCGKDKQNIWQIRELLSGTDLIEEGKKMQHCVATYAKSCASGQSSIWTLDYESPMGTEKCLTIEVTRDKRVVQCRGRFNREPTSTEIDVVSSWARREKLNLAHHLIWD